MKIWLRAIAALLGVLGVVLAGGMPVGAQDATPAVGDSDSAILLEASIRGGTCDRLGEVVSPLPNLAYGFRSLADLPAAATPGPGEAQVVGPNEAIPAATSVATVPASIDRLTSTAHAVDVVHASPARPATSAACGVIGGFRVGNDLVFGLRERNDSDYVGTAWLHENPDGTTTVSLVLASRLSAENVAGSAATQPRGAANPTPTVPPGAAVPITPTAIALLPQDIEGAAPAITGGTFTSDELALQRGDPTVLHVVNVDDRGYRLRIPDLLAATPITPQSATIVQFTTPVANVYEGHLLAADADAVLDTVRVDVRDAGGV